MLTQVGKDALLKMAFQGDNTIIAAGANFYLGLCNQIPVADDILADITTEPLVANGYARKAIARNTTGFPTVEIVNGETRILSLVVDFAAAGGDFSASFNRAFICSAASGSVGTLFGYSGAYATPILLADGQNQQMKFEFHL